MTGKAIIFCAPSGAGKTTIVKHLIKTIPSLKFSISATTRAPRGGVEEHGKDYYFLSEQEFQSKLAQNELLEWQEVYEGTYYGTLRSEVERIWLAGNHVIFDVDVIGGINLKKAIGDRALSVFVNAESVEVLRERLENRNTESAESLEKRVGKAAEEMKYADQFDYVLINRELTDAFAEAEQVVNQFISS
ncbi:guanylate kinase [Marinoscillum furvescens]|uniref:Guanylate kinase n=1 Tax=Marinoscillum furvescens DSM 4134 TaxID=1122208 RepID=A0A3D9L5C8_MARFU|nr:guanylate kinase [Marinoscillum furvescens]RED99515.1 guanylate kinase [Marinoscillum furvescens DSM 4134]